jgi:beta-lactamase class A
MINIRVFLIAIVIWCNAAITFAAPYAAIVIDADTGKVLHFENANNRLHPARLTKLATLYAAFEAIETREIDLDAKARISLKAANEELAALGMHEGQSISIRDLIRATAIKGANDTSTALAEAISGSEQDFTKRCCQTNRLKHQKSEERAFYEIQSDVLLLSLCARLGRWTKSGTYSSRSLRISKTPSISSRYFQACRM